MEEETRISPHPVADILQVVCGIIGNSEGQVLACLRPAGKHLGGLWEFPGGKVDPGETPEIALTRELREELGVEVSVRSSLNAVIWQYPDRTVRLLPFHCTIETGEPQALEHEALRWCSAADFSELPWADADWPVLRELFG